MDRLVAIRIKIGVKIMIKIGILGYGNLGKGVESAVCQNPDMELAAVFTRRNPENLKIRMENVPVLSVDCLP